jgi:nitroimidazol reductase NimA-like FMN-containing flavoprotein (pyridoxamine 5'-phosphate oxidase superfamily)
MIAEDAMSGGESYPITKVNKVKRVHERGRYDKATVHAILDAALIAHIAYVIDGRPYCTATAFWREGEHLYWHGSSASQMIKHEKHGAPVCVTVSHVDALVQARSGFHHSINYRSVMAWGTAHAITDTDEKLRLMDNFIDRIFPGRSRLIRQPTQQELKATTLIGMEIETASGKIRDKHVADDEEDYAGVRAWSALIPVTQVLGEPSECPRQLPDLAMPAEMKPFRKWARLDEVMTRAYAATFGKQG